MVARMKLDHGIASFVFTVAATVALQAPAGAFPDPTRPPAALLASPSAAASAPMNALQLQSVLLGHNRTPAAVISGELVLLGGRYRDARLVRVTERFAVLKGAQGETVLSLIPGTNAPGNSPATPESTK